MSGNHDHDHSHAPSSFNLAFALAVVFNLTFVMVEVFYALSANSMTLLADAMHNFGDVFGLALAWGANWLMSFPARKRYSYGFKRITIVASLGNALILVATSALIVFESVQKLFNLSPIDEKTVIIVALIGIAVNGGTSLLFMRGIHDDLNIKGAFVHLAADALIALGVVVAACLIYYTGMLWLDPVISLVIVMIILWNTWKLLRDSVRLVLDGIPHHIDHKGVKQYLLGLPGVTALHDFHIWGLSTREIALTAHLIMPKQGLADTDYERINAELKSKFKIDHVTLQVETGSVDFLCEGC